MAELAALPSAGASIGFMPAPLRVLPILPGNCWNVCPSCMCLRHILQLPSPADACVHITLLRFASPRRATACILDGLVFRHSGLHAGADHVRTLTMGRLSKTPRTPLPSLQGGSSGCSFFGSCMCRMWNAGDSTTSELGVGSARHAEGAFLMHHATQP